MEVDINEVIAAIDTLYNEQVPTDPAAHKVQLHRASEWLGNLQKSVSDALPWLHASLQCKVRLPRSWR